MYKKNHLENPLLSHEYEALFNDFYKRHYGQDYCKGEMPFEIDEKRLGTVFINIEKETIPFDSGFHKMLLKYISVNFNLVSNKTNC